MQQISEYFRILTKLTKLTDKYFPDVSVPQRTTTTMSETESDRWRPAVLSTWWPLAIRSSTGTDLSAKLINATVHVWPAKHFDSIIKWAVYSLDCHWPGITQAWLKTLWHTSNKAKKKQKLGCKLRPRHRSCAAWQPEKSYFGLNK